MSTKARKANVTSFERTWVGYPVRDAEGEERRPGGLAYTSDAVDRTVLTTDMVEQLRQRLRDAEALEESGIRAVPALEDEVPETEAAADVPALPEWLEECLADLDELEVKLGPKSESNFYAGFDDEHPQGVFLATHRRLAIGTPVYVEVHVPGRAPFRAAAVVEWAREAEVSAHGISAGLGLRMCGLSAEARRAVRAFLQVRPPLFHPD